MSSPIARTALVVKGDIQTKNKRKKIPNKDQMDV